MELEVESRNVEMTPGGKLKLSPTCQTFNGGTRT